LVKHFSKSMVCGLLVFTLICVFSYPLALGDTTTDYLFIHNNDSISLMKANPYADEITFHFYSISGRSRIDIDKGAGVIEEKIIFKNSDGWQSRSYSCDTVKIIIKETGNNQGTPDLPGDSDVVIRINSSEAKVFGKNHEDSAYKGKRCSTCGKTLSW